MIRALKPAFLLPLALALGALAIACGGNDPNAVDVSGFEFGFEFDADDFVPGTNEITFTNDGGQDHHLQLMRLTEEHTLDELLEGLAAIEEGNPPPEWAVPVGGVAVVSPGESATITDVIEAGNYALVCFVPDAADGVPHFAKGMATVFTVGGDENDADLPDADAVITGVDDGSGTSYSFEVPDSVDSGDINIEFVNDGTELHEVTLIRIPEGLPFDDFMAALTAETAEEPAGPPPTSVGGVQAILPGASQVATLDLEEGSYALVCFVPNPAGIPHAFLGMVAELTVE